MSNHLLAFLGIDFSFADWFPGFDWIVQAFVWLRDWVSELLLPLIQALPPIRAIDWTWLYEVWGVANAWLPISDLMDMIAKLIIWKVAWAFFRMFIKIIRGG